MDISQLCVVALTWTLQDTLGDLLDELETPVEFLVGGDDLLARIEEALQGHSAGAQLDLHLEPEEAFGDYNENLVFLEPRAIFPAELVPGMSFESLPAGATSQPLRDVLYTVTEIYPEHVVLDANHPLAGIALRLSLQVQAVREATEQEIEQRSAGSGFFRVQSQAPSSDSLH
jgi:FKBP-type peptidyl-prolyl cis-trans isomerase SlyD